MSKKPYIILKERVAQSDELENKINQLIHEGYIPAVNLAIVPGKEGTKEAPLLLIAMAYSPAEAEQVLAMCEESQDSPPASLYRPDPEAEVGRTNEGSGRGSCLCSDGSCSSFTSGDEGENEP